MKVLGTLFVLTAISLEAQAGCSNQVLKDVSGAVKSTVYSAEKIPLELSEMREKLLFRSVDVQAYPPIKDVKNCIAAYKAFAAFDSCRETFASAEDFSSEVRAGAYAEGESVSLADSAMRKEVSKEVIKELGTTVPAEVLEYFKKYPGIPSTGGYFAASSLSLESEESVFGARDAVRYAEFEKVLALDVLDLEKKAVDDKPAGGYQDYFSALTNVTEKCNQEDGIPTFKAPELVDNRDGLAVIDVFKNSVKKCSFVVTVNAAKEVRFKVPSAFKNCVANSDAMIAHIEERDNGTGKLLSKKVAASSDMFISQKIDETIRAVASEENAEIVDSLLDGMDAGGVGNLSLAANVKPSNFNYKNISSLDKTTLDIVKYCEWGVNPSNSEDEAAFLEDWNSGVEGELVSADNSRGGNYYWAMYFHQYQNMLFYPELKKLHEKYKNGLITKENLYNWEGAGYAMCMLNYPAYWNASFIFDYIADGVLDDRTAIPSSYWNSSEILK